MSGIEIGVAVVSAVASLITAYKDGNKIVDRIKKKRAKREGLPPSTDLEKALQKGQADIVSTLDENPQIPVDGIAAQALKDLIIDVQGTLLDQLAKAEKDDEVIDFSDLISSVVSTRRKAINVLNDLFLRTQENSQTSKISEPHTKDSRVRNGGEVEETEKETVPTSKRESFLRDYVPKSSSRSLSHGRRTISFELPRSLPLTAPSSPQIIRRGTTATSDEKRKSAAWTDTPPLSPEQIHHISRKNDFKGFCKGAYHSQNLNLKKAVEKSMRSYGWAYHCTKCDFKLMADTRDQNHPCFDDRIYFSGNIRFRLLFLLKSHVSQRTAKDPRCYRCIICALAGMACQDLEGEGHLFEHMCRHEGQELAGVQLCGPVSLSDNGVEAASLLEFDVQFQENPGEAFSLPPSAIDGEGGPESEAMLLPEEAFGNVWADQSSN